MGVFDALSNVLSGVDRAVETAQKVSAAIPRVQRAAKQLKESLEQANAAAKEVQDAVKPVVDAVRPVAPYPPDVVEAATLLGVTLPIDRPTLETAFKQAAFKAHPDRGGSATRMKAVNAARATLRAWCAAD